MSTTPTGLFGLLAPALPIQTDSDPGEARRVAVAVARAHGFTAADLERIALVTTELASNLAKYAVAGRLLVRATVDGPACLLELLAIDDGPGMRDVLRAARDGVSTGGTLGGGLGAVSRVADECDLHSVPGRGTVVLARFRSGAPPRPVPFEVGAVVQPLPGEEVCGDGWAVEQRGSRATLLLVDGLGHGWAAAQASQAAVAAFATCHDQPVERIAATLHDALRPTRGAAIAVAELDRARGVLRYCGIGNIEARVVSASGQTRLLSQFGIAGYRARSVRMTQLPLPAEALVVMHTDGVSSTWELSETDLLHHDPTSLAGVIARDAGRGRDDSAVLVARTAPRWGAPEEWS